MVVLAKDEPESLRININTNTGTITINNQLFDNKTAPNSLYALIIWAYIFGDKNSFLGEF